MPRKNIIKSYLEQGYYHPYNRGVNKRTIFADKQDYGIFLSYLKCALTPPPNPETISKTFTIKGSAFKGIPRQPKNFFNEITLVCYNLLPNHFHFLVQQQSPFSINKFMHSLSTRYSMYFNKKYKRIGSLFQSSYRGILVKEDSYLLHLSRYIHINSEGYFPSLTESYSSYTNFLGIHHTTWVKPQFILNFFGVENCPLINRYQSYQQFVESSREHSGTILGDFTSENDDQMTNYNL